MAPNIIGLGLIVAGIIFLILVIGGIMALWMTYRRRKYPAT